MNTQVTVLETFVEDGRYGFIDASGLVVVAPKYKRLEQLRRRYWLAVTDDGLLGVLDQCGEIFVTPTESRQMWIQFQAHLKSLTAHVWEQVLEAKGNLSPFAGIFNCMTERLELVDAGLWELDIVIIDDCTWNGIHFSEGEIGRIEWSYPGSRSLFDLAKEAPVTLADRDSSCGAPWGMLRLSK